MKPRLDCLPLSEEDTAIWHLVVDRFYRIRRAPRYAFTGLWSGSLTQGRRDADLMLYLTSTHVDIRPGTEEKYRYVWRLSHAFQGIPTVGNEDVA
jgi:hypothetical protein